jgi:hypothetical protein
MGEHAGKQPKGKSMENRKTPSHEKEHARSTACRIPYMEGRPKRETAIDHDDLLNLEIALNTCENVEELLKQL